MLLIIMNGIYCLSLCTVISVWYKRSSCLNQCDKFKRNLKVVCYYLKWVMDYDILFLWLALFLRGRHSRVIHTTDLAHVFTPAALNPALRVHQLVQPPVLGHTHSGQFPLSNSPIRHVFGLWGNRSTQRKPMQTRTCKLHTERHPGSAKTRTRDLLAVRKQCYPLSHRTTPKWMTFLAWNLESVCICVSVFVYLFMLHRGDQMSP